MCTCHKENISIYTLMGAIYLGNAYFRCHKGNGRQQTNQQDNNSKVFVVEGSEGGSKCCCGMLIFRVIGKQFLLERKRSKTKQNEAKRMFRQRQDSNLRVRSTMDQQSIALTTRPRCLCIRVLQRKLSIHNQLSIIHTNFMNGHSTAKNTLKFGLDGSEPSKTIRLIRNRVPSQYKYVRSKHS